jgi:hypothetical protein
VHSKAVKSSLTLSLPETKEREMARLFIAAVLTLVVAHPAIAEAGTYISGAFGTSNSNVDFGSLNQVDGDGSTRALGIGYEFNRHISLEASYRDLGNHDGETNCPPGFACLFVPLATDADLSGISVSLIGTVPLSERWGVYARLGLMDWDIEYEGISSAFDDSDTDMMYGVGAKWSFDERWEAFVEYDRVELDVDTAILGIRFHI